MHPRLKNNGTFSITPCRPLKSKGENFDHFDSLDSSILIPFSLQSHLEIPTLCPWRFTWRVTWWSATLFVCQTFLPSWRKSNLIMNLEPLPEIYKWLLNIKNCFSNFCLGDGTDERRTRPSQGLGMDGRATLVQSLTLPQIPLIP